MKDMEFAKKWLRVLVVDIVCLFIIVNGAMNDRITTLEWLAVLGVYASQIYACAVVRGWAIGTAVASGLGLVLQMIGEKDSIMIAMYMAVLIPAAAAALWHRAKNR